MSAFWATSTSHDHFVYQTLLSTITGLPFKYWLLPSDLWSKHCLNEFQNGAHFYHNSWNMAFKTSFYLFDWFQINIFFFKCPFLTQMNFIQLKQTMHKTESLFKKKIRYLNIFSCSCYNSIIPENHTYYDELYLKGK